MISAIFMQASVWAHIIGFFGEALNLAGAIVLTRDIFNRKRERDRSLSLAKMGADARKREVQSLYYHDIPVDAPDFAEQVTQLYATKLAYLGLGLLMAGFACLAVYHVLEMVV